MIRYILDTDILSLFQFGMTEIGVHTTAELTKQAITLGLIAPPESSPAPH